MLAKDTRGKKANEPQEFANDLVKCSSRYFASHSPSSGWTVDWEKYTILLKSNAIVLGKRSQSVYEKCRPLLFHCRCRLMLLMPLPWLVWISQFITILTWSLILFVQQQCNNRHWKKRATRNGFPFYLMPDSKQNKRKSNEKIVISSVIN